MKNDFVLAFNEVLEEKQLPREVILQALEAAMVSAYRRAVNASNAQHVEAQIDPESGKVTIFAEKEVVEVVQDERTEVSLEDALKVDGEAVLGGMAVIESTPRDFGRVAAQTARQVIQQRIREAERESQMNYFSKQIGEIVSGIAQAVTAQGVTLGLDMKAEGILPRNQQVPGERFRVHDRVQALLLEVKDTPRGPQIVLSRAHRNFLRRLLENEVPEIYHGLVEIRSIAREPGQRSKVAVAALQPAVDPVGACVGVRGVRIQAIVRELNDEKIDVIEWNPDPAAYIAKALSPARVNGVYLNELARGAKTATVVVPEDQLSLAIGRDGQNARLAAKLTSWRIDIKSLPEAASDALYKLQKDLEYAFLVEGEAENIPQVEAILTKKSEGRPVTPEEYQVLNHFVDRIERGILNQRHAEKRAEEERIRQARIGIPEAAFDMSLVDLVLSDRVFNLLNEAGYETVGELMLKLNMDSDAILGLSGIGPKAMEEIQSAVSSISFPEPEPEPETLEEGAEVIEVEAGEVETEEMAEMPEMAEMAFTSPIEAVEEGQPVPSEPVLEALQPEFVEPEIRTDEDVISEPEAIEEKGEEILSAEEDEGLSTFDALFALRPDVIDRGDLDEDEEETAGDKKGKKGKKKKKRFVEVEYDPDRDIVVVKRKRKRGGEGWDEELGI